MQDVVAELRVGVKDLAAEDRAGWVPLALSDRVRDLVGLSESMQVELVRGLAGWDRATAWAEDGAVTAVGWLKANSILTGPEASGLVRLARLYAQHRCVAAALDGGDLTLAKARLLARAERNREGAVRGVRRRVRRSRRRILGHQDFGQVIDQWIDLVDDQPPPDDAKRRFTSADTIGGSAHTDMFGSADDAALMRAAIEALDTPDPDDCPEGPRSRQQRHYDIVIDLFRRALADQLGDDVASPTSADVILDATTAAELVADPDQGQINLEHPLLDLLATLRPAHRRGPVPPPPLPASRRHLGPAGVGRGHAVQRLGPPHHPRPPHRQHPRRRPGPPPLHPPPTPSPDHPGRRLWVPRL